VSFVIFVVRSMHLHVFKATGHTGHPVTRAPEHERTRTPASGGPPESLPDAPIAFSADVFYPPHPSPDSYASRS